jgi:hypothetical protein
MVIWASPPLIERVPIYMTKRTKKPAAQWPPPDPVIMLPYAPIFRNKPKSAAFFPPSQSVSCHGLNTIFLPPMKPPKNFIKQSQNPDRVVVYAFRPCYVGFAPFLRLLKKCYIIKGQYIRLYSVPPRFAIHIQDSLATLSRSAQEDRCRVHFKNRRNKPNSSDRPFPPNSLLSIIVAVNIAGFRNPAIPFYAHNSVYADHPP